MKERRGEGMPRNGRGKGRINQEMKGGKGRNKVQRQDGMEGMVWETWIEEKEQATGVQREDKKNKGRTETREVKGKKRRKCERKGRKTL